MAVGPTDRRVCVWVDSGFQASSYAKYNDSAGLSFIEVEDDDNQLTLSEGGYNSGRRSGKGT